MKKLLAYTVLLASAAGMASCNLLENDGKVPEEVKLQFSKLYPTITNVEWDSEDELYEAEFEISGREREALFKADGELVKYIEEIEEQYLPQLALEVIQAKYNNCNVSDALRVQQNATTQYLVKLKHKQQELTLLFDTDGNLLAPAGAAATAGAMVLNISEANVTAAPEPSLGQPVATWQLPAELREISGIALVQPSLMACVQDEEGSIYLYDLQKKAVTQKIRFAAAGDYEGIAIVGSTAYVLRSDGTLFEVPAFRSGKAKAVAYPTSFAATQDTEGLAFDKANNRLLISCKGYDETIGDHKGIYAFSLDTKKLAPEPVILIPLDQEALQRKSKKQKSKYDLLQPSTLEIHPETGELYIIDSPNSNMLTISEQGKVQQVVKLDDQLLRQPEGLAFDTEGDFYIASEGSKKGQGVLVKFKKGIQ